MNSISTIVFFWQSLLFTVHPFHAAIIEVNQKEDQLQVILRLFLDDAEQAIKQEIQLSEYDLYEYAKKEDWVALKKYIERHFSIIQQNQIPSNWIAVKADFERIHVYLEFSFINSQEPFEVKTDLLTAIFPDQENIIHYQVNDELKNTYRLNKSKQKIIIKL